MQVGLETDQTLSQQHSSELKYLNFCTLCFFTFECAVHILAEELAPWHYFKNFWYVFDLFLVSVSWYFLETGSMVMSLRIFRLVRMIKLMNAIPELKVIITAIVKSLSSIVYIGILLATLFYFYGVVGVSLFAQNDPWHFGTLHVAFLTLFQCVTLDNWLVIMNINLYGCAAIFYQQNHLGDLCEDSKPNFIVSSIYFTTFILLASLVVLTLFVSVIGSAMIDAREEQRKEAELIDRAYELAEHHGIERKTMLLYKEVCTIYKHC